MDQLVPGMRINWPVYGPKGELLLNKGTVLMDRYIFALKRCGVMAVRIESMDGIDEGAVEEAIEERVRLETMSTVRMWAEHKNGTNVAQVVEAVEAVVEEILEGKVYTGGLAEISASDSYTFAHSVDVCVLAVTAGAKFGYKKDKLMRLGVGSLLHDLGKIKVPPEILNKPNRLTPAEMAEVKRHTLWGYKMLVYEAGKSIEPESAEIVLDHHERLNGHGYPRKLHGNQISEMATLCALADVYNAMTTDRAYRRALSPSEVYEMLQASGGTQFDFRVVQAFLQCVEPYPVGTLVWLSSGDVACVIQSNPSLPLRPAVALIPSGQKIALKEELSLVITGQLTPEEARAVIAGGKLIQPKNVEGREDNEALGNAAAYGA